MGKHEAVIKVLSDNGATLSSGDVGHFACFAAEQNDIDLLQEIINFGGDVAQPDSHGTTPLHAAISHENVESCKLLIEQGADAYKPDADGWTPRALADHQGNEEIKALLQAQAQPREHKGHQGGKTASPQPPAQRRVGIRERSSGVKKRGQTHLRSSLAGIITAGQRQTGCQYLEIWPSTAT